MTEKVEIRLSQFSRELLEKMYRQIQENKAKAEAAAIAKKKKGA